MTNAYIVTGTLADRKTVFLDESIPLPTGKVRVTVETAEPSSSSLQTLQEWLADLQQRQAARGHVARSRAEIDTQLRIERESWD